MQSDDISGQLRRNDASWRLKGDLAPGARHLACKPRKATSAVSAHLRFPAIGIEVAHSEIRVVRWIFQQQNAICSDTAMAITKARDLAAIEMDVPFPVIEQDKIVSSAIHLCEPQHERDFNDGWAFVISGDVP